MSLLTSAEADFVKGWKAVATAASKVKNAVEKVAGEIPAITKETGEIEVVVNGVLAELNPQAAIVATAVEAIIGKVFSAVSALGTAAVANGLNVSLDEATVTAVKAALPAVKAAV